MITEQVNYLNNIFIDKHNWDVVKNIYFFDSGKRFKKKLLQTFLSAFCITSKRHERFY